jgi:hypothetical protein
MRSFKSYFINESFDNPYRYKNTFTTETIEKEDDDTGETYMDEVLTPVQIIRFKTDAGVPYLWYARQSRYDDSVWEIAFGVETGKDIRGNSELDITVTKTGDAFRVFATAIEILNDFIELDENYEIRLITFTSKGDNRTRLYAKRFIPMINNFELDLMSVEGDETKFILSRTS